ncbi:MAG: rhomboid family intramembrane serine protease [Proteobacteria bacterium]|nr:rhomboid family intramembrane serine protease [Pseudomonadota bacterium]
MILPIGDQPNPRGFTPWVTYGLIAVNVAIFALISLPLMGRGANPADPLTEQYLRTLLRRFGTLDPALITQALREISAYDVFVLRWGYRPAAPSVITLFSSLFLHGGWLHLIGNMLFLWIYGDNVEHRLGRVGYLLCYLATGAAATLAFAALAPASAGHVPLVGASGAISGVLGFYFIWFPRNKVRLFVLFFPFLVDVWLVGARLVLGFYLVIENLLPFFFTRQGGSGVAYGAHLGGFVAGVVGALLLDRRSTVGTERAARRQALAEPWGTRAAEARGDDLGGLLAAHDRGDLGAAALIYLDLPAEQRRQVAAAVVADLGDWLARQGQTEAALTLYRRGAADHTRDPQLGRLLLGAGLVLLYGKQAPASAYPYLLDVLDVGAAPELQQAARHALADIERLQKLRVRPRERS